jgi:N-dimethylarginine dimethylaminohydrolase
MSAQINRTVLMSGPTYFAVKELNPYSDQANQPDPGKAAAEFAAVKAAVERAGVKINNHVTGIPDSFFYDIDLAVSILRKDLIAWCPEALMPESQERMRRMPIEKIEVTLEEAMEAFACNLLSTGETVVMGSNAPQLKAAIEAQGLTVITVELEELAKGGGFIRCTTLTLDND